MIRTVLTAAAAAVLLLCSTPAQAHPPEFRTDCPHHAHAPPCAGSGGHSFHATRPRCTGRRGCTGRRHWRDYSFEERRNFPDYYGGYRRYFGGFHANYYRDYPGRDSGLNNDRYGWGSGWAW